MPRRPEAIGDHLAVSGPNSRDHWRANLSGELFVLTPVTKNVCKLFTALIVLVEVVCKLLLKLSRQRSLARREQPQKRLHNCVQRTNERTKFICQ